MQDDLQNQDLVNDDVAQALDSLSDIDPAQPMMGAPQPPQASVAQTSMSIGGSPVPGPSSPVSDPSFSGPPAPTSPLSSSPISEVQGVAAQVAPLPTSSPDLKPQTSPLSAQAPSIPSPASTPLSPLAAASKSMNDEPARSEPKKPEADDMDASALPNPLEMPSASEASLPEPAPQSSEEDFTPTSKPQKDSGAKSGASSGEDKLSPSENESLRKIREEAAIALEPILDEIDDPEDKFDAIMTLVPTKDDHNLASLLEKGLDAAKSITDKKARADALREIMHDTHI